MTDQKWYRSATLWISLIGQALGLLLLVNIIDVTKLEVWETILMAVINLLVTLGILSNPTKNHAVELKAAIKAHQAWH